LRDVGSSAHRLTPAKIPAMKRRTLLLAAPFLPPFLWAASQQDKDNNKDKDKDNPMPSSKTVYELRIYHAAPGKLAELLARFRDHTDKLFDRHGMKSVAYWTPIDEPQKSNTLIYILPHPSREDATTNWKSFQDDPEWKSVKEKSELNGKRTEQIDSTFLALTDFSPSLR
jgi:hypothetical protein